MHSCRTVSCLRTGRKRDTRKRNYVNRREEGKSRSHLPLTTDIHSGGWNRSNESVIVLSSTRTRITPLTSLTLDTYRKMFPARFPRSLSTIDRPCIWLSSLSWTRQRLTAFKVRSVTVTLSTGDDLQFIDHARLRSRRKCGNVWIFG